MSGPFAPTSLPALPLQHAAATPHSQRLCIAGLVFPSSRFSGSIATAGARLTYRTQATMRNTASRPRRTCQRSGRSCPPAVPACRRGPKYRARPPSNDWTYWTRRHQAMRFTDAAPVPANSRRRPTVCRAAPEIFLPQSLVNSRELSYISRTCVSKRPPMTNRHELLSKSARIPGPPSTGGMSFAPARVCLNSSTCHRVKEGFLTPNPYPLTPAVPQFSPKTRFRADKADIFYEKIHKNTPICLPDLPSPTGRRPLTRPARLTQPTPHLCIIPTYRVN